MAWPDIPNIRPWAIAHRGASGALLENTLPAIEHAIALGADGVEIDVQLSQDGAVMVFHDHDLLRLARRPELIADMTLAELREVRLLDPIAPDCPPHAIPTLREVLDCCHGHARVDIELKTDDPRLVNAVLREVREADFSEHAFLTSFNPHYLRAIATAAPDLWVGYLIALEEQIPLLYEMDYPGACIPMWLASAPVIGKLKEQGKLVVVWTVNHLDDIYRCIALGADAIVSNYPERVLQARAASLREAAP